MNTWAYLVFLGSYPVIYNSSFTLYSITGTPYNARVVAFISELRIK
jgi:hypothetical protein